MLKRMFIKKIVLVTATLFAISLLYLLPKEEKLDITSEVEYMDSAKKSVIYLLNDNNYLCRTKVTISDDDINIKAKLDLFFDYFGKFPSWYQWLIVGIFGAIYGLKPSIDAFTKKLCGL